MTLEELQWADYKLFKWACQDGDLTMLKDLTKVARELDTKNEIPLLERMIQAVNYAGFRWACWLEKLETVKLLIRETKRIAMLEDMLKSDGYSFFKLACNLSKTDVSKYLLEEAGVLDVKMQKEMLKILSNSLCDKYGIGREHV